MRKMSLTHGAIVLNHHRGCQYNLFFVRNVIIYVKKVSNLRKYIELLEEIFTYPSLVNTQ